MGFGMGDQNGLTLKNVREAMIKAADGDPSTGTWDVPIIFRRRLDGDDLVKFFDLKLKHV